MKIIHFADLHLGVENYGHIEPETGLSSRVHDFLAALDQLIDYALQNRADLVLFCGDAYKSREPGQTLQRELAKRLLRLSESQVPIFLLIGNHDLPNAVNRATATEIFATLAVKNVHVAGRPDIYRIATPSGTIQVAALPWLRRSALMPREEIKNLPLEEIKHQMEQKLTEVIASLANKIEPSLPAIMAAHVWVSGAKTGSESLMYLPVQEPSILLSNIALHVFDYIALGHIHKGQVLQTSPPVVYAGSLGRVDFSEENEEKGFWEIEIQPPEGRPRQTTFRFQPVNARRFLTIRIALDADDPDPTATILSQIGKYEKKIKEAIVRLELSLPSGLEKIVREGEVRSRLAEAHQAIINRQVTQVARTRIGVNAIEQIGPMDTLKAWLESKKVPPERQKVLLEYGQKLINKLESS